MIIACPECTQPFQVEDGDIAPLVQIECPHCAFRMILDFEAANDASLIEAGMQMAQGFSTEAEYRTAVGAGTIAVAAEPSSPAPRLHAVPEPEPEVAPVRRPEPARKPEPEPAATEPEPELPQPPVRVPRTEPPSEKPPVRLSPTPEPRIEPEPTPEPSAEPSEPAEPSNQPPASEKPPVRIRRATFEPAPEPTPEPTPPQPRVESRSRPTLIAQTAPPPALRPPAQSGVPRSVDEPGTPVPINHEVEVEVDLDEPQPSPDARHSPPHTPPVIAPALRAPSERSEHPAADSQSRPIESREAEPSGPESADTTKPSVAGTVFKVLLLLILLGVAGVMVWSLIETGNPNPLPMLQERFGFSIPGL